MATVMLVGSVGVIAFVTLFAPTLPIRCSSDSRGVPMKPAVYYAVEDVASVDFKEGRAYRQALNDRCTFLCCIPSVLLINECIVGTYPHRSDI